MNNDNFLIFYSTIAQKLFPLFVYILLGFIGGKVLKIEKSSIAKMLIYLLAPLVFFEAIWSSEINLAQLSMPLVVFSFCSIICLFIFKVTKNSFPQSLRGILAFSSGSANTGYFGIPTIIALLGADKLPGAILAIFGYSLYEYTVGFYIAARGNFSAQKALKKVLSLPALYALVFALTLNSLSIPTLSFVKNLAPSLQSAYSLLGMFMIGLGIASAQFKNFNFKFISTAFFAKFILWPASMLFFLYLEKSYFPFYSETSRQIFKIMSIVPLAANGVSIATELKTHPEEVSIAIVLSTLFALIFIPIYSFFFL